jgi:hypothetical protein
MKTGDVFNAFCLHPFDGFVKKNGRSCQSGKPHIAESAKKFAFELEGIFENSRRPSKTIVPPRRAGNYLFRLAFIFGVVLYSQTL